MTIASFKHVQIRGIKTVIPAGFIDIDDELQYFDNNPKKLARAKKMMGYGRRYIADELTTVTDLACDAAEKLLLEMGIDRNTIDMLIFVNQKPDYPEPCDACIAHGRLTLSHDTAALDINLGCSGYLHALLTASAMIESGAIKKCLLLAGDLCGGATDQSNRKAAQVFGDAASATILEYSENEIHSTYIIGADGTRWDRIIHPFGGTKLPINPDCIDLYFEDGEGNLLKAIQGMMKGEDVFKFTMDVAPKLIKDTMEKAGWCNKDVDLFAIHQANKQIVTNIISIAGIPAEKTPIDVFSKYANNSTNSVVTVLCDQSPQTPLHNVILCAFGIGLSWGCAAINLTNIYNGGISKYVPNGKRLTRTEQIEYWKKYTKGDQE